MLTNCFTITVHSEILCNVNFLGIFSSKNETFCGRIVV